MRFLIGILIFTVFSQMDAAQSGKPLNIWVFSSLSEHELNSYPGFLERHITKGLKNQSRLEQINSMALGKLSAFANVKIKHRATLSDFYNTILDPSINGIFWIGHSASADVRGLGSTGAILDYNNEDISSLLPLAGKGLLWLSIVGCNAKPLIDDMLSRGAFTQASKYLRINSYGQKIELNRALARSIEEAYFHLLAANQYLSYIGHDQPTEETNTYLIKRTAGNRKLKAGKILVNDQVKLIFDKAKPFETQTFVVNISKTISNPVFQVHFQSVDSTTSENGRLEIESLDIPLKVAPILGPDGNLIGQNINIYIAN
ncbi:MAG: hypothetical protein KDD61_15190 [Bdellovibrionales bacterium]|nr:hypothetical protein [Bdellovibrionales bacterium]